MFKLIWKNTLFISSLLALSLAHGSQQPLDLVGKWRGVLTINQNSSLTIGVNIAKSSQDGSYSLTIDSPNQGSFNRTPSAFNIGKETVSFSDQELNVTFTAKLTKNQLVGTFTQGKPLPIALQKLDASDLKRTLHEGTYRGSLIVNKQAKLPLQLNIAVIHNGYLATLDSPAQKSYGIPISNFSINEQELSFTSPVINATYEGKYRETGYEGTFTQGTQMPLTLTKNTKLDTASKIDNEFGMHGGVVAVIENGHIKHRFYGKHNLKTQYEIGSITKTMTAYLLAEQLATKEISANYQIRQFSPNAPDEISILQLATHTSGLPRLPANLSQYAMQSDPFANFDENHMHQSLKQVQLTSEEHLYSNFGYGVLAKMLADRKATSFSNLLSSSVFKPMNMKRSYVAEVGKSPGEQLAKGYNLFGKVVSHWQFDSLAGAGAVVSNIEDMTKYTLEMIELSHLQNEIGKHLFTPYHALGDCCAQGLGWVINQDEKGKKYAWHNGKTGGFASFLGFYFDGSRAIVMLNNQAIDFTEYAMNLLTQQTS